MQFGESGWWHRQPLVIALAHHGQCAAFGTRSGGGGAGCGPAPRTKEPLVRRRTALELSRSKVTIFPHAVFAAANGAARDTKTLFYRAPPNRTFAAA